MIPRRTGLYKENSVGEELGVRTVVVSMMILIKPDTVMKVENNGEALELHCQVGLEGRLDLSVVGI